MLHVLKAYIIPLFLEIVTEMLNLFYKNMLFLLMQGYEDGDESSARGALQKKRKDSAASSQGSKASATAGTGDKQTLKSEKEDGEKDEYGDDFEEDKTEGKIQHVEELIGCFDVISIFFSIICCPYTVFCEYQTFLF